MTNPEDAAPSGRTGSEAYTAEDGSVRDALNPLLSGEETAKLVERLQTRASNWERIGADDHAAVDRQAAALLTTQASEIERDRGRLAHLQVLHDTLADRCVALNTRATTAEAERDEARVYARALEANRPTLPQHAKLMTRANAAEATVASQAVRIAELEKALEPRAPCILGCPDICKGKYRDEGEPCCILRTTLAVQPQDHKEA